MSRTYLQLCRDVISDLGVAGGTLQSVSGGLNQEQQRCVNWVARADLYIQNLWADWTFLWYNDPAVSAPINTSALLTVLPPWADNMTSIDTDSLWQDAGLATARRVPYMEWGKFYALFQSQPKTANPSPSFFSQDPMGQLWLSNTVPAPTPFALSYWCVGKRMTTDQSISRVPNNFDTIICEQAKIFYAQRENAQEILTGSTAQYTDMLDKMQAFWLPNNTASRKLRNDHHTIPQSFVE